MFFSNCVNAICLVLQFYLVLQCLVILINSSRFAWVLNIEYAYCPAFARDVKVAASGIYDVNIHLASALHKTSKTKTKTHNIPMTSFFAVKPHSSFATIMIGTPLSQFLVKHNLSSSVADYFTDFVKMKFPDSEHVLVMFTNNQI